MEEQRILNSIAQTLFDKKGENILVLDVRMYPITAEYVMIAEGSADRHVIALAEGVKRALAKEGLFPSFEQGTQTGDWVVLDYAFIVVHLFMPGMREKYNLERLWPQSTLVDVDIVVRSQEL